MNTNRVFEFGARRLWPAMRHLVGRSRRCRRCILSERYAPLADGLCPECSRPEARSAADPAVAPSDMAARFDAVIRSHTGRGRYDAALLLSGGKDSAYILDRMRREYPELRILCVTVNNGLMSPAAMANAEHASSKLKADLLVVNDFVDEFARALREAFLNLNGRGTYGVVDRADGDLIYKIGREVAADLGIGLLIGGLSWVQLQRILGMADFERKQGDGPREVFPLAVWRTDEQEIRRTVRERGLMLPGTDSPIVSNHELIATMAVVDILNLGYSSFEPEFAQLVREGKTDRRTWLHVFELLEFAVRRGLLDRDLRRGLARLNLKVDDVIRRAS
jgi:hypothetical protein